jgi:hypothetical protein
MKDVEQLQGRFSLEPLQFGLGTLQPLCRGIQLI